MKTMTNIENACKLARDTRSVLEIRAKALQSEIAAIQQRKLPGIRKAAEDVAAADAALLAALQEVPHLFRRPKSVVFHGLKVGFKAGSGKLEIDDADRVIKMIRKHLVDKADVLIKVKETPIKKAIAALSGEELKKIGVTVQAGGEVVFVDDALDGVDKLVAALLKGAEVEAEAEEDAEEAA